MGGGEQVVWGCFTEGGVSFYMAQMGAEAVDGRWWCDLKTPGLKVLVTGKEKWGDVI
jgi:hypothetical protein